MTQFRTLYADMNSFFSSVEQQENPELRGRPVAITAIENEAGCVVAASSEAKAFGVKTGTRVYEAKQLCPGIVFRPSRHRLYVRYNQQIAEAIDRIADLERIRSIDEFQVGLGGIQANLDHACQIALEIKQAIFSNVGTELHCSIGIGPNPLLAKIAGKLIKPDGLEWLGPENMPERIAYLALDELPGISKGTLAKLNRAGIHDIESLYELDPRHARLIWHSIEGERFVRSLQGENVPITSTKRGGYGNSKVLAPQYRARAKAKMVGRWLMEKSAERLRRDQYCTRRVGLSLRFFSSGYWAKHQTCFPTQDTRQLLHIYETLWGEMTKETEHKRGVVSVSVQLGNIQPLTERSGELFTPGRPGQQTKNEVLSVAIDRINRKYQTRIVRYGEHQEHFGFFERGD